MFSAEPPQIGRRFSSYGSCELSVTHTQKNPVRYSIPLLLLLSAYACSLPSIYPRGTYTTSIWIPWSASTSGSLMRELAYITMGTAGFIGAYYSLVLQRARLRWNRGVTIPLCLLLGWCALSLLWSAEPAVSAKRLFVLGLLFLGAFGMALSWTRLELLKFIALSAAIQVAVGFAAEIVFGYFTPWQPGLPLRRDAAAKQPSICLPYPDDFGLVPFPPESATPLVLSSSIPVRPHRPDAN